MLAYLDGPGDPGGGEPLAGALRPGNAGANTAADQIEVAEEELEQLPAQVAADAQIVLRCDSAGAGHDLLEWAREGGVRFSIGFDLTGPVREAIAPHSRSALGRDARPGRLPARQRRGRRGHRPDRPLRLAGGLAPDRAKRAAPSRRPALLHRFRRPPLPGDFHRPRRPPGVRARYRARCEDRIRCPSRRGSTTSPSSTSR